MAIKTFAVGEVLTASDTNTYLANSGLVYVSGGAMSASTNITADSVFTSTYRHYVLQVVANTVTFATSDSTTLRFRTGGSSNTTSNYVYQNQYVTTSATYARVTVPTTFFEVSASVGGDAFVGQFNIYSPQTTEKTFFTFNGNNAGTVGLQSSGRFNATTSFDGFILALGGTSTWTGTWRLYGMRDG